LTKPLSCDIITSSIKEVITMNKISEMERLMRLLDDACIPYEVVTRWDGYPQLWYPYAGEAFGDLTDVVCTPFTYGGRQGLLEIAGPLCRNDMDDVEGWLTGMDVFLRIFADHCRKTYNERG
jgi:hypothetical protein